MIQFPKHFTQDLNQDIKIRQCGTIVFNADDLSNVVSVDLYNGDTPATPAGTVVGAVICSDGSTVPIDNGTISGNTVSITLTAACFAITGQIGVGIQLVDSGVKTTVLKAIYNVERFETDDVIDPDSRITMSVSDLIDDIAAAIATIPADYSDLMAAVAPTFNTSTAYAAGAYVWYDGALYRFTAAHTAGNWTGTDATAAVLSNDIAASAAATDTRLTAIETEVGDVIVPKRESTVFAAKTAGSEALPTGFSVTPGYLRNMGISSPGNLAGTGSTSNNCFYMQAAADMDVWFECNFGSSQQIGVFAGAAYGTNNRVTPVYASNTEAYPLPTEDAPLHVEAGQYITFSYYGSNSPLADITWTLYTVTPVGGHKLKSTVGLTAKMREEIEAMLAEVQALTLENT